MRDSPIRSLFQNCPNWRWPNRKLQLSTPTSEVHNFWICSSSFIMWLMACHPSRYSVQRCCHPLKYFLLWLHNWRGEILFSVSLMNIHIFQQSYFVIHVPSPFLSTWTWTCSVCEVCLCTCLYICIHEWRCRCRSNWVSFLIAVHMFLRRVSLTELGTHSLGLTG